ncbi:hypothetical protein [Vibrio coralliilyticus]|nr:hypothetical protein [Vibrio coralliilyticus]
MAAVARSDDGGDEPRVGPDASATFCASRSDQNRFWHQESAV